MITVLLAAVAMSSTGAATMPQDGYQRPAEHEHLHRVVVLPFVYRGGNETAIQTARDTVRAFFDGVGYDQISTSRVESVWGPPNAALEGDENYPVPAFPTDRAMRDIGESMHADLVVAGRIWWHNRSIWVALGPKSKSTVTVDLKMVAVGPNVKALDVRGIQASDTDEESGFQTAAGILTGTLVTIVSGGPITPHEQRASQIALSKAFEPWLEGALGRRH